MKHLKIIRNLSIIFILTLLSATFAFAREDIQIKCPVCDSINPITASTVILAQEEIHLRCQNCAFEIKCLSCNLIPSSISKEKECDKEDNEAVLLARARFEAIAAAEAERQAEAELLARARAEAAAAAEAERLAAEEAERKAEEERQAEAQRQADILARARAEAAAAAEAERLAAEEAERKAEEERQAEAQRQADMLAAARAEAAAAAEAEKEVASLSETDLLAKARADAVAKAEAERQAEADLLAQARADAIANAEAEADLLAQARADAIAAAQEEADLLAKARAEAIAAARGETDDADTEEEEVLIPEGLRNNAYYLRSLHLAEQAQVAFDAGNYGGSYDLAQEAIRYADRSDRYIATQLIAEAKRLVDWADSEDIQTKFPVDYAESKDYYESSITARDNRDWNNAISSAIKSIEILAYIEIHRTSGPRTGTLPAQYTVRTWAGHRECLWVIAGYPWVYGDSWKWRTLYEANRSRMPNPNNPNLIQPGFILDIPSIDGEVREGMWDPNRPY